VQDVHGNQRDQADDTSCAESSSQGELRFDERRERARTKDDAADKRQVYALSKVHLFAEKPIVHDQTFEQVDWFVGQREYKPAREHQMK
jgi:hypothetical protein